MISTKDLLKRKLNEIYPKLPYYTQLKLLSVKLYIQSLTSSQKVHEFCTEYQILDREKLRMFAIARKLTNII